MKTARLFSTIMSLGALLAVSEASDSQRPPHPAAAHHSVDDRPGAKNSPAGSALRAERRGIRRADRMQGASSRAHLTHPLRAWNALAKTKSLIAERNRVGALLKICSERGRAAAVQTRAASILRPIPGAAIGGAHRAPAMLGGTAHMNIKTTTAGLNGTGMKHRR